MASILCKYSWNVFFIFLGYLKMLSGLHSKEYMFWNYLLCFEGLLIRCKNVHSFEGLPWYNGVGNAYTLHGKNVVSVTWWSFSFWRLASSARKVYVWVLLWGMFLHWVKYCKCGVMRFKCLKAYIAVFMSEFGLTFSCIV